jgi:GH24 family phage-related lysozyme (muramidase)
LVAIRHRRGGDRRGVGDPDLEHPEGPMMAKRVLAADLREVQADMRDLDLYDAVVDGKWGPSSYAGVKGLVAIARECRPVLAPPEPGPSDFPAQRPAVNYRVALEVGHHEAVIRQAYRDSVGVWTWSVGLTSATGHNVERYIGNPQTMQRCLDVYVWALRNYAVHVDAIFDGFPLSLAQYAGALSFHWNTGALRRASWPRLMMAGRYVEAESSLRSWNKAGGRIVAGLVKRRAAEADLIWRGRWANDGRMLEYQRLTARSTPDWSSGARVDVRAEMLLAFGNAVEPVLDQAPQPFNMPAAPTLTADAA